MTESEVRELQITALGIIEGEPNLVANLSNLSSVIYHAFPGCNWVGFYLWNEADQELVLGPFQGKPACLRIKEGRGVCGKAFAEKSSQLVTDVHQFSDHIACDPASRSELVVPLLKDGRCYGVLDLDAPVVAHFTEQHRTVLTDLMAKACQSLQFK